MALNTTAYKKIKSQLDSENVLLVAVSKTKPIEDILAMYKLGQRDFGENYVQELLEKQQALPKDIRWHFIGHLQSNKVKLIAPFIHLIQTVDSEKLLLEINKQAFKINRTIQCLLQVYISQEETKFGMDAQQLGPLITKINSQNENCKNLNICGLMGMASFTENKEAIRKEFRYLKALNSNYTQFSILSMGMSADYKIGIEEGSNMVRIGNLLFGER